MKAVKFNVEITKDGYSAWYEYPGGGIAATMGDNVDELRQSAVESYNALIYGTNKKPVSEANIQFAFNLKQFFEYYNVINVVALAKRMGMNYSLLKQYISGVKIPSEAQTKRVLLGVKKLGQELAQADFVKYI